MRGGRAPSISAEAGAGRHVASPNFASRQCHEERGDISTNGAAAHRPAPLEDAVVLLQPALVRQWEGTQTPPHARWCHPPLSRSCACQMLRQAFEVHGEVIDAFVAYNGRSSRGFGYVTFKEAPSAAAAVASMNGVPLGLPPASAPAPCAPAPRSF